MVLVPFLTPKTDWQPADKVRNTDMNRIESNSLYALGFIGGHTDFLPNGNIVTTYPSGDYLETVFAADGSIVETMFNSVGDVLIRRTTTFNTDGSINEEVVL